MCPLKRPPMHNEPVQCVIISLKHTSRDSRYITLWRGDDKGYCYRMAGVGRYPLSQVMAHQGYYNTGHADIAVDAAVIERLVTAGYPKDFDPDGIECQVVLNTKENWEVILGAVVATPKEQPKPLYKGARYKKAA